MQLRKDLLDFEDSEGDEDLEALLHSDDEMPPREEFKKPENVCLQSLESEESFKKVSKNGRCKSQAQFYRRKTHKNKEMYGSIGSAKVNFVKTGGLNHDSQPIQTTKE